MYLLDSFRFRQVHYFPCSYQWGTFMLWIGARLYRYKHALQGPPCCGEISFMYTYLHACIAVCVDHWSLYNAPLIPNQARRKTVLYKLILPVWYTNKYQDIQLHVMYMYMTHVTTVVHTFISILRYVDFYSIYTSYKVSIMHVMYTNIYYGSF